MKKQNPRYTSIDLTYEIFGRAALVEAINVVIVSTVVTPNPTLAGVAPRFNQKLTHDITTIKLYKKLFCNVTLLISREGRFH